jgi:hypothetical protein
MGSGRALIAQFLEQKKARREQRRGKSAVEILTAIDQAGSRDEINAAVRRLSGEIQDPTMAADILEFARTQRGGLGEEQFLREATSLALPSQIPGQIDTGLPPTQAELGQDILSFAAEEGVGAGAARGAFEELSPFARDFGEEVTPPYKIGSKQRFIGDDGEEYEGTFVGLDAQNEPKWRNPVKVVKPEPAGRKDPKELSSENMIDNIRGTVSRIAGIRTGENILTEALGEEGRKQAIKDLEVELQKDLNILYERDPDLAKTQGLHQGLAEYEFNKDSEMDDFTLGEWDERREMFKVISPDGKQFFYDID